MSIQLGGTILLGPNSGSAVDYSDKISQLTINFQRPTRTIPATFGQPIESEAAGPGKQTVTLTFYSTTAANDVWMELYDAIVSDAAELYFSATYDTDAVSTDNSRWEGTMVVTSLDTVPEVGSLRVQTQSYPVTAAGVTKDDTP